MNIAAREGSCASFPITTQQTSRYVAWFHELDAWTEYWDVYHPESRGRYYFGDGDQEIGLLTHLLPREKTPPLFSAWKRMALNGDDEAFISEARVAAVADALAEVDEFVGGLFVKHFGDANDPAVQADYLEAIFQFAIDAFPPATERLGRLSEQDPRRPTAGRHTLDGDIMWFAWSLQLEAAQIVLGKNGAARRSLLLSGVASGCPANFAWRGHRRTRREYRADSATKASLRKKAFAWISDFDAAASEIHALFRIREWGFDE